MKKEWSLLSILSKEEKRKNNTSFISYGEEKRRKEKKREEKRREEKRREEKRREEKKNESDK